MRKEISPELYNYNKFPGPEFKQIGSKIIAEEFEFELVENYKEAFDLTAFHQRFSEILNKFDYIVGDWGNEQLRLRGFYRDQKAKENAEKISRLQDYLLEYCNYGCAYFVLENAQPRRAAFDKKSHHKRKSDSKKNPEIPRERGSKKTKDEQKKHRPKANKNKQQKQGKQAKPAASSQSQRHFVIRQK